MNRYRETVSIQRCQRMAAEQGLMVLHAPRPHGSSIRRYAVVRADRPVDYAPLIYVGLQALHNALKGKDDG